MKKILYCGMFSVIAFGDCEANQFSQVKAQVNLPGQSIKTQIPNNGMALRTGGNSSSSNSSASSGANDAKPAFQSSKWTLPPPPVKWVLGSVDSGNIGTVVIPGSYNADYFFNIGKKLSACRAVKEIKLSGAELTDEKVDALLKGLDSCDGVTHIETLVFEGKTKISDELFREITAPGKGRSENYDPIIIRKGFCVEALKGDDTFIECSGMLPTMKVKFSNEKLSRFLYSGGYNALQTVFADRIKELKASRGEKENVEVWINGRDLIGGYSCEPIGKALSGGCANMRFNFNLAGFDDKEMFCFSRVLWENAVRSRDFINRLDLRDSSSITPAGMEIMRDMFTRAGIEVGKLICGQGIEGKAEPLMIAKYDNGNKSINMFDGNVDNLFDAIFPPVYKNMEDKPYNEVFEPYSKVKLYVPGRGKDVAFFERIGTAIGEVLHRVSRDMVHDLSIDLRNNDIDDDKLESFVNSVARGWGIARISELDLSGNRLSGKAIRDALVKFKKAQILIETLAINGNPGAPEIKPIVEIIDKDGKKEFYKENIGSLAFLMDERPEHSTVFKIKKSDVGASLEVWSELGIAVSSYIKKISSMDLSNNGFGDKEITSFFEGIWKCISEGVEINELILDSNKITGDCLRNIINMCRENSVYIKRLSLNNNPKIKTDVGIRLLCASRIPRIGRPRKPLFGKVLYEGCEGNEEVWDLLKDMNDTELLYRVSQCKDKVSGGDAISLIKSDVNGGSFHYEPGERKKLDLAGRIISDADVPQLIELLQLLSNKGVRHVLVDLRNNFLSDIGVNSIIQSDVFGTSSKCLIEINIDNNIASKEVCFLEKRIGKHTQDYVEQDERLASSLGEQAQMVESVLEREVKVQKSVESLNTQIETLRAQLDKLETERNTLMKELDGLDKRMDELSADYLPVKEARDSMTRILDDKDEDIGKLNLFVGYSETIRVNKKFIGEYQDEIERLKEKLEKIEQLKKCLEEIHQLERKLVAKRSENDDETEDEVEESQDGAEETEEEIQKKITTLQEEMSSIQKSRMEGDDKKTEEDTEEETAEAIRAEIKTLQAGIAGLEEENKAKEAAIAELFQEN